MVIRSFAAAGCIAALLGAAGQARALQPPSLTGDTDLGSAVIGGTGEPKTFTATNTSSVPVGPPTWSLFNGTGIWSVFGASSGCPVLDPNGNVPPGAACSFDIVAWPQGLGPHTGDVLRA